MRAVKVKSNHYETPNTYMLNDCRLQAAKELDVYTENGCCRFTTTIYEIQEAKPSL